MAEPSWYDTQRGIFGNGRRQGSAVPTDPLYNQIRAEVLRGATSPQQTPQMRAYQPTAEDNARAEMLRKQQKLAQIMALSGDSAMQEAARYTAPSQTAHDFFNDQARRDQLRQYQHAQLNMPGRRQQNLNKTMELLQQEHEARVESQVPQGMQFLKNLSKGEKAEIADRKVVLDNVSKYIRAARSLPPLTQRTAKEFEEVLGIKVGASLKWVEGLGTALQQRGAALSPEAADQARFWADMEAELIAPWRNRTFGATLTPNEQTAFERMLGMTNAMDPEDLALRLEDFMAGAVTQTRAMVLGHVTEYGGGALDVFEGNFGDYLNQSTRRTWERGSGEAGGPSGRYSPPRPGETVTYGGITAEVIE